jgi:hypothetical protein
MRLKEYLKKRKKTDRDLDINKLSNRYKGGTFNKNLSMKRSDKNE